MSIIKRIRRSIIRFIRSLKRHIVKAARVAEQVTQGQIQVTKSDEIILDEPTTEKATKRFASMAIGILGIAMLFVPTEFRFMLEIGDRLIRLSTMMWDGEGWTRTA